MSDLFMRMAVGGRFFGLNVGDWSMLLGGVALVGLLALPICGPRAQHVLAS
jgi:hypothetical protein